MAEQQHAKSRRQTVHAKAAEILIDALDAIGGDVAGALAKAGLSGLRDDIRQGETFDVPRASFARLSHECVLAFHYIGCRRDALRPFPVSNFRLLCLCMLACPNLHIAIETAGAFHRMALGGRSKLDLTVRDGAARLVLDTGMNGRRIGDMLVMMYGLAALYRLFGWLTGEDIELTRVTLNFPVGQEQTAFNELLQLEPELGQPCNAIEFADFHLDQPIIRKYADLSSLFTLFPFDLFPPETETRSLPERIRAATRLALSRREALPNMAKLARMFGLSVATFRRRLADEGASLSGIRSECRRQIAERLLRDSRLTVKEIASRTQFSDVSAFRRAFRGWHGQSPLDYRNGFTA